MHPAKPFHWGDRDEMLAFVGARGFVTIVGGADRLLVAQVPVIVDGDRLLLHLSRGNPMLAALPLRVVVVAHGPDGYVSPDFYDSPDQVPTWNYVSVEIDGLMEPTDDAMLRAILERETAIFEARIPNKEPWTNAKLSPGRLDGLARGICGATIAMREIRGTRKLTQNKTAADRAGVIAALAGTPLADEMSR